MARKKARKAAGHDDIDHKIRVNELKEEIREIAGTEPHAAISPDCPPEIEEAFFKQILAFEKSPYTTHFDMLKHDGFDFPEAEKLNDKQIAGKLSDLAVRLSKMHVFLSHTDHLSDREFYQWLRDDGLREEVPDMRGMPGGAWHLDVLGSYGEEQVNLYNKYYATEKQRRKHRKDYPDWPLPPHEDPKYDRDSKLPKGEFQ